MALVASEGAPSIVDTAASVPSAIGRHAPAYLGAAREPGGVAAVDAHALATVTGTSFNTTRQYWARVRDLARAAAWTFDHLGRPATDHAQLFPGVL